MALPIAILLACVLLGWDGVYRPWMYGLLLLLYAMETLWLIIGPKRTADAHLSEDGSHERVDHLLIHKLLTQNMGLQKTVRRLEVELDRARRHPSKMGREIFRTQASSLE